MMSRLAGWLLLTVFLGHTFASPLCYHEAEARPLAAVSELGQRLAARAHPPEAGSSAGAAAEQRLALPTPQDLEAIKKVAQILVMLGEQVIPSIIGDSPVVVPPAHVISYGLAPPDEVPNDPLDEN